MTDKSEPGIPKRATISFSYYVASQLLRALADARMYPNEIDAELNADDGWTRQIISGLIDGVDMPIGVLSEIAYALSADISLAFHPKPPSEEPTADGEAKDDR